ncbi:MAG: hypothetical protein BWY84_01012 [Candidatus Aerophobetes bacterium ADurb.Bin490]|nr:MAG: hypothetical protein BWY84_01012 [Candidatus Aerophobetes bacterium ADurb.Bin490]
MPYTLTVKELMFCRYLSMEDFSVIYMFKLTLMNPHAAAAKRADKKLFLETIMAAANRQIIKAKNNTLSFITPPAAIPSAKKTVNAVNGLFIGRL